MKFILHKYDHFQIKYDLCLSRNRDTNAALMSYISLQTSYFSSASTKINKKFDA